MSSQSEPYFRIHLFACTNRRPDGHRRGSCAERGAEALQTYLKAKVKKLGLPATRVNSAGCLDRCELGPVLVIYPEGVWYTYRTEADIDEIVQTHLVEGKPVERLRLAPDAVPS